MNVITKIRKLRTPLLFGLLYILICLVYFHPLAHNFKRTIFTPSGDPEAYMWFIYWWPYAITHGLNPFITHYVWSPSGFNLTWAASIPTLSLLTAPLTIMYGPIFSWNLLSMLAAPLNAFCAFLLLRYIYKDNAAAFLGGYIFGFSSYVMGQLLGHLNLDFVCLIPLALLFFIINIRNGIKRPYFIAIMAIIIFLEAGISTEVLATATLFGFISIVIFFIFESNLRKNLFRTSVDLILAYILALIMLAPFIYFLIKGFSGVPKIINSPSFFSSDLLNYIIPTPITRIGRSIFFSIASRFTGNYSEEGAYIGLPLFLLTAFSLKENIAVRKQAGLALLTIFIVVIIFSLGPQLHINGVNIHTRLPWTFFTHIPLIRGALPTRFANYASLIVAIAIGFWLSTERATKKRYVAVLATIIFIIPNVSIYNWGSQSVPSIFTKHDILAKKNVIVLPFGNTGPSMFWQLESGMAFNMVGGYVGFTPLPFRKLQVTTDLFSGTPGEGFYDLFKAYCARFHVQYVVVCHGTPAPLAKFVKDEGWLSDKYGQCIAYHVPHGMKYFEYSGDTWGNYNNYSWIGKSVTIKTSHRPIKIFLTGQFIPNMAPHVAVKITEPSGNVIYRTFIPGNKSSVIIKLNGSQCVRIVANNTWNPNNVIHNGDTRRLSISMKIKNAKLYGDN